MNATAMNTQEITPPPTVGKTVTESHARNVSMRIRMNVRMTKE
jgi:hypothetical protein